MTEFSGIGKMLVIAGIGFIVVGGILWLGGKIPGIGQLPGDIVIKRENFTFYFPVATCIILSLLLSLILALFRRH
jgi:hypothetical protein